MADHAAVARPEGSASKADWLRDDAALWPWIGRFLWSPAVDLHPTRRAALLPGWPADVWDEPRFLQHISRHLLTQHGLLDAKPCGTNAVPGDVDMVAYDSHADGFLLALLPQAPLARLARRIGMTLHGAHASESIGSLDDDDRYFLTQRMPLYWHVAPVDGSDPEATGWQVLRVLMDEQPEGVKRRFAWKTPLDPGHPAGTIPSPALLTGLIRKVLKEFETPWSSLFATLRRPGCQIRLQG